jgi:hypothetical protein
VLGLMTALLIIQIAVVYLWGIEPNQRPLEELEAEAPQAGAAAHTARA